MHTFRTISAEWRRRSGRRIAIGIVTLVAGLGIVGPALAAAPAGAAGCDVSRWAGFASAANGKWVSAELGNPGGTYAMLRARGDAQGPWERFSFVRTSDGHYAIRSGANGLYVSAELGNTGGNYAMLRARAGAIGPWEKYDVVGTGSNCAIRSVANGRYVSAELGNPGGTYAMLRARATAIGPWEAFNSPAALLGTSSAGTTGASVTCSVYRTAIGSGYANCTLRDTSGDSHSVYAVAQTDGWPSTRYNNTGGSGTTLSFRPSIGSDVIDPDFHFKACRNVQLGRDNCSGWVHYRL